MRRFVLLAFVLAAAAPAVAQKTASGETCLVYGPVDRLTTPSSACLRCHDGSAASDARTGHSFDLDYARARTQPRSELSVDPEAVNSAVVLQGGLVVCLTCHSGTSTLPHHLAARVDGPVKGRLCVACHPMM